MNKNIMMTVLMMGVGFGEMMALRQTAKPRFPSNNRDTCKESSSKSIIFQNTTANTFIFNIINWGDYCPQSNMSITGTLSANSDRNNTQAITLSDTGSFTISTHYKKDLSKMYKFADFNETGTYSISLKGGQITVKDPSGNEIQAQP